jgi:hypothetical protein
MFYSSILLIAAGILTIIAGATFKILHWPNATLLMQIGLAAQWVGIGLLVYHFMQKRKKQA